MADYAGQAASVYDPQMAAEQATLKAGYDSNMAGFTGEENAANTAYTQALRGNTQNEAAQEDKNNFTANTHGLWQSGLIANMQRLTGRDYGQKAADIETARAQKLADIAARRQAETMGYNAKSGALASKYQGLKNEYIIKAQDADAKAAQQAALEQQKIAAANARASASASRSALTGYGISKDASGGLQFHGAHGLPISAAQYVQALGGGISDLADVLSSSGNKGDQQIVKDINGGMSQQQLVKKYPWVFRGV